MDSNNIQRNQGIHGLSASGSMDPGALNNSAGNNELLFSTLRNLATRNSETAITTNGLCNATSSFSAFPILADQNPNNFSSTATSTSSTSSAWLDQAKFSLLPMYGMFQSSLNSSETYRNNLSWMDSNIQQAAVAAVAFNAAASLNAMQNLPSLGYIGPSSSGFSNLEEDFQRPNNESKFGSPPSTESLKNNLQSPQNAAVIFQRQTASSSYSQSTASTAHTPQSTIGQSMQSQTTLSPDEAQSGIKIAEFSNPRDNPNVSTAMEELSELDLQDFEDFLMEKPSTSFQQQQHSPQHNFFTAMEMEKNTSVGKSGEYRCDELTSADIELDRLVSLVASQNTTESSDSQPFTSKTPEGPNNKSNTLSNEPVFELPKFTPPDSPSERPSTLNNLTAGDVNETKHFDLAITEHKGPLNSLEETFERYPSTADENLVLIPKDIKPEILMTRRKANKLPIYKQNSNSLQNKTSQSRSDNGHQSRKRNNDAYSFEDDELLAVSSYSVSEVLQSAKRSTEGFNRIGKEEDQHSKTPKRKYTRQNSSSIEMTNAKITERTNSVNSILTERMKRKARTLFASSEIANDDHSVLTDIPIPTCTMRSCSSNENDCTPLLPKLIIRFPKKESSSNDEQTAQKHATHKGNKRKKRDKDVDWTETKQWHGARTKDKHHREKRHKKGHHKKRKYSTEADQSAFVLPCSSATVDQPNICGDISNEGTSSDSPWMNVENSELLTRLNLFERPTDRPRRGTFLLPKDDIFNPNCALWRIDNQNLLQKYLPIILDGVKCYHNSSTYSGWCEHYVEEYISVKVEYIKQSRSENIVRPIIPLQDLFPATNFPTVDEIDSKIMNGESGRSFSSAADQQFLNCLITFMKMMLKHAVSLQFVQHVRQNNEWTYLCALTEVESMISRCVQKIRNKTPFWLSKFVDDLQLYPRINSFERLDDDHCLSHCQACSSCDRDVRNAIQLFSLDEQYDHETLAQISLSKCDRIPSQNQAIDFYVCSHCEHFALSYHKAFHLCFALLKSAEEKLELFSAKYPDLSINELILKCLEDKMWINKIVDTVQSVTKESINEK